MVNKSDFLFRVDQNSSALLVLGLVVALSLALGYQSYQEYEEATLRFRHSQSENSELRELVYRYQDVKSQVSSSELHEGLSRKTATEAVTNAAGLQGIELISIRGTDARLTLETGDTEFKLVLTLIGVLVQENPKLKFETVTIDVAKLRGYIRAVITLSY